MPAEWESSDAWVFAAIGGSGIDDGTTLTQLIAAADAINHAILTEDELVRAVPRLIHARLVQADIDADRYWRTEAGHDLWAREMKRRGLFGWIEGIPPALRRLGPPQDGVWALPPGAFDRAVGDYLAR